MASLTDLKIPEGRNPDRLREVLSGCNSFEDVRKAGILFHGSCVQIEGNLHGGGYDGVFWMAEMPSVAQAYIPRSGMSFDYSTPSSWEMDDPIRPTQNSSHAFQWALEHVGAEVEDLQIEWEGHRPRSWRVMKGWPKIGDYHAHIQSLGYVPGGYGTYRVLASMASGKTEIFPADYRMPGQLIVALPQDFKAEPAKWSPEALAYATHNRVGDFQSMAEAGLTSFRMMDKLQSDFLGNVSHPAIGILPAGIERLDWMAIPARRHDGEDLDTFTRPETEEFTEFMCELNPDYRSQANREMKCEMEP